MTATISCDHAGADADHTAYAGMCQVKGGNASSATSGSKASAVLWFVGLLVVHMLLPGPG